MRGYGVEIERRDVRMQFTSVTNAQQWKDYEIITQMQIALNRDALSN